MADTLPIPDLWPAEVEYHTVLTPIAIMRFQANQLRERTKGMLEGEVRTSQLDDDEVLLEFEIVAPPLDRYRYSLFSCKHRRTFPYPVEVIATSSLFAEQPRYVPPSAGVAAKGIAWTDRQVAESQEELLGLIKAVLTSSVTKSVIQSLIATINEKQGEKP